MTSPGGAAPNPLVAPDARLALDRYIIGLWSDRDLEAFVKTGESGATALAPLQSALSMDRPRVAEELRARMLGARRPSDLEKLEALLREAVDRASRGMSILPELQHDLLAHAGAASADDPRARAVRVLSELAGAAQVHASVQEVGRLAEATVDRVARAREAALRQLGELLASLPHLAPRR